MRNLKYLFIFIFLFTKIFAHNPIVVLYNSKDFNEKKKEKKLKKIFDKNDKYAKSQKIIIKLIDINVIDENDSLENQIKDIYKLNDLIHEKTPGGPFKINIIAIGSAYDVIYNLVYELNLEDSDYVKSVISVNFVESFKETRAYINSSLQERSVRFKNFYTLCGMEILLNDEFNLYVRRVSKYQDEKIVNFEELVKNKIVEKKEEKNEIEEDVEVEKLNIVNNVKNSANPPVIVLTYEDFQKILASQQNKNDIDDVCCWGKCTDRRFDRILRITELTLKVLLKVAV
ncbi:MAG: hypothetical protein SZ59_C0002G0023 [candidate division TM6 bacterium GW2011_GWF2_28_16]|nr:MAG: hypothetical protein SZ59_C0002G0023 [candidate division TM6 bacterium GW2011_GWF2_28_16]